MEDAQSWHSGANAASKGKRQNQREAERKCKKAAAEGQVMAREIGRSLHIVMKLWRGSRIGHEELEETSDEQMVGENLSTLQFLLAILDHPFISRKTVFYDNFVSFWMRHSKHIVSTWTHHFKHSCHIGHF